MKYIIFILLSVVSLSSLAQKSDTVTAIMTPHSPLKVNTSGSKFMVLTPIILPKSTVELMQQLDQKERYINQEYQKLREADIAQINEGRRILYRTMLGDKYKPEDIDSVYISGDTLRLFKLRVKNK